MFYMFSLNLRCNGCVDPDTKALISGHSHRSPHNVLALMPYNKEALPTFNTLSALDAITLADVNRIGGLAEGSVLPEPGQSFSTIVIDKNGNYYCPSCYEDIAVTIAQRRDVPRCLDGMLDRETLALYPQAGTELDFKASLVASAVFLPFAPLFVKANAARLPVRLNAFSSNNHTIPRFFYDAMGLDLELMLKELNGINMRHVLTSQDQQEIIAWMNEPAPEPVRSRSPSPQLPDIGPASDLPTSAPRTAGRQSSFIQTHQSNTLKRLRKHASSLGLATASNSFATGPVARFSGNGSIGSTEEKTSFFARHGVSGSFVAPGGDQNSTPSAAEGEFGQSTLSGGSPTASRPSTPPKGAPSFPGERPLNDPDEVSETHLFLPPSPGMCAMIRVVIMRLAASCPPCPPTRVSAAFTRLWNSCRNTQVRLGERAPLLQNDGGEGGNYGAPAIPWTTRAGTYVCDSRPVTWAGGVVGGAGACVAPYARRAGQSIYQHRQLIGIVIAIISIMIILALFFACKLTFLPLPGYCEPTSPAPPIDPPSGACNGTVAIWNVPGMVVPDMQLATLYDWLQRYNISPQLFQEIANNFQQTSNTLLEWLYQGCSQYVNWVGPVNWAENTPALPPEKVDALIKFPQWFIPQVFDSAAEVKSLPLSLLENAVTHLRILNVGREAIDKNPAIATALNQNNTEFLSTLVLDLTKRLQYALYPGVGPMPVA